uniref:Uncharacterized protein n=1 Tax=Human herpesvirus 2 TaxID=10310 RepID=A0A481TG29_HHV2|nr:hypothetical protein [Human alphaherpesvirus 2]
MEGVRGGEGERAASSSAPSRSGGGDGIVRTASSTIEASRASCRGETTPSAAGSSTASPDAGAASSASASASSSSSSFSSGPPCHPNPGRAAGRRSGFGVGGGPSAGSGDPGPPVVSAAARRRPPSSSAIATSAPRPCVVVVVFFFFRCSADIASDRGVRGVFFFFRGGSGGGGWRSLSPPRAVRACACVFSPLRADRVDPGGRVGSRAPCGRSPRRLADIVLGARGAGGKEEDAEEERSTPPRPGSPGFRPQVEPHYARPRPDARASASVAAARWSRRRRLRPRGISLAPGAGGFRFRPRC